MVDHDEGRPCIHHALEGRERPAAGASGIMDEPSSPCKHGKRSCAGRDTVRFEDTAVTRHTIGSGYDLEGSYGYSRAVRVGDHVYVSGTTARGAALEGGAYAQARAILDLIEAALAEAGAQMRHVVRTVVYVTDLACQDEIAKAHGETFGSIRPASTLVQVVALTPKAARVEIEVTAFVSE